MSAVAICAGAGILIGVLSATGLNFKITYLIEYVAQGNLFVTLVMTMIACIILGMGLPTVAAYVVLATLVPASMIKLGVPPPMKMVWICRPQTKGNACSRSAVRACRYCASGTSSGA